MINTYLIASKARLIKQARQDFLDLYGIEHTPFTRKIFFYFFVYQGRKYVHKESLNFVYSNADTYTREVDPYYCQLTKQLVPVDVCGFLEQAQDCFLPDLLENNDKFLVFDYYPGTPTLQINTEEFYRMKQFHYSVELTPFYNSMAYNLVRSESGLKLVDLKHFEPRDSKPFFVYMYNRDAVVNDLYIESGTDTAKILEHLSIDYPVDSVKITEFQG